MGLGPGAMRLELLGFVLRFAKKKNGFKVV